MAKVSVLVLTKNEEQDLPDCLKSVEWSDDIHVLDSKSTDRTVDIALSAGCSVAVRPFDGYALQRNFGLSLGFKHPWVLVLDADERATLELAEEIATFVACATPNIAACRIRRRDIWWGRWLKHAQMSPYYVRLLRVGRCHYEREVNEVLVAEGEIAELSCAFDHYPFSKGLKHWIEKHNNYSSMEAGLIASGQSVKSSWKVALLGADFNERRLHQKALFYRLPARPLIKLLYMLVVRRAFLDGMPGVRFALLQMIYEYFIVLKTKEIQSSDRSRG